MNCPFCGEYNDDGEILCTNCGIKLVKRSKNNGADKIKAEWHDVDYEDGYSDVKKSVSPDIKLPFIDYKKILYIAGCVILVIAYVYCKYFWEDDTYPSIQESYELLESLQTTNTASEDVNPLEDMLRSSIAGVWVLTDDEDTVYPEYHLFRDGKGYIYVKGMYTEMPITWECSGSIDNADITIYYSNNQKVREDFRFENSVLIVSETPYTRVSEEDILGDDTLSYELDEASLAWAGTYWTHGLDKMTFPIILLGENGRGQINYPDGKIVTFSWVYEEGDTEGYGFIHMSYVSIDSPDYMMRAEDDCSLYFDTYGLFVKESD